MKINTLRRATQLLFFCLFTGFGVGLPMYNRIWGLSLIFPFESPAMMLVGVLATSVLVPLLVVVLVTLLFGRVVCGWVCLFGTVMEIVGALSPLKPRRLNKVHEIHKYALLLAGVILTPLVGFPIFAAFSPIQGLFRLLGPGGDWLALLSVALVVGTVMVFGGRVWCRTLCPLGALLSLVGRFSLLGNRKVKACRECGVCNRKCPMAVDIPIWASEGVLPGGGCIRCGACVDGCSDGALAFVQWRMSK